MSLCLLWVEFSSAMPQLSWEHPTQQCHGSTQAGWTMRGSLPLKPAGAHSTNGSGDPTSVHHMMSRDRPGRPSELTFSGGTE